MEEKCMVNDILQDTKNFVKLLDDSILESNNLGFRQMVITLRNSAENYEGELYKIAESKGYYFPSESVEEIEIANLRKNFL